MRGSGDSEGLYHDEYAPQEQADALEVLDWISQQPWYDGRGVAMYGKSWGGFNGLQVNTL
jgi:predicted acyl esterase